jgi:hypothetical protein
VLLAGCSKAGNTNNANAARTTTSTTTTTTASPPKPSVEAAKPQVETPSSGEKVSTPEDAAQGLFDAWKSRNREAAAKFATDAAITMLYMEGDHVGLLFQGCEKQRGDYNCSYYYEGGGLIMLVRGNALDGYKVEETSFIAD